MYKGTLDAFGKFFDAYTKKGFTEYDERETFEELCKAMRIESQRYEKNKSRAAQYVAKRREDNPNYARPEREHVKIEK